MTDDRCLAKNLVLRLVAAYNAKDLEGVAGLYAGDAHYWSALSDWSVGIDSIRSHIEYLFEERPDEKLSIKALVTNGQVAVVELESTGTSPVRKHYRIQSTEVIELREGQIARVLAYLDPGEIEQLME